MIVCNNTDEEIPIIQLFDLIGAYSIPDGWGGSIIKGIDGAEFAEFISFLDRLNKKRIDVYIHSLGGSIVDGMAICTAIKMCATPVNTVNVGVCASMASAILQAGKTRQVVPWSQTMIHNPSGGDTKELAAMKEILLEIMTARSGISKEEMSDIMDNTTWLTAEQCLTKGLADEIVNIESGEIIPKIDMGKPEAAYKSLLKVVAKLETIENQNNMKVLASLLDLPETATEAQYVKAVNDLKSKAEGTNTAKASKEEMEGKLIKAEKERDAAKDALAAKDKECDDLALALSAEMEDKAVKIVDEAIACGKIKPEAKDKWIVLAKANLIETTSMLDGINGSKPSAKFGAEYIRENSTEERPGVKNTALLPNAKVKSLAEYMAEKSKAAK